MNRLKTKCASRPHPATTHFAAKSLIRNLASRISLKRQISLAEQNSNCRLIHLLSGWYPHQELNLDQRFRKPLWACDTDSGQIVSKRPIYRVGMRIRNSQFHGMTQQFLT